MNALAGQTRRSLLQASAAGAGAILLGGCGGASRRSVLAATIKSSDIEMINHALALEQRTIALYTAGGPLLTGVARKTADTFLANELRHAGQLRGLLKPLHAKAHDPSAHYDFGQPRGPGQVLAMLHELERRQIAFYLHAIPRMSTPQLRQSLASIMANDAQHITLLRAARGLPPLTGPFLTASE